MDIKKQILIQLKEKQPLNYSQLAKEIELSIWTISDLVKILEKEGKIKVRTFGGAKLVELK